MKRLESTAVVADGLVFVEPAEVPERLPPGEYKVVVLIDDHPASDWQPPEYDGQGMAIKPNDESQ